MPYEGNTAPPVLQTEVSGVAYCTQSQVWVARGTGEPVANLRSMPALAPSVPADVRALLDSLGIEVPVSNGAHGMHRSERVLGQALSLPETVHLVDALDHAIPQPDRRATTHWQELQTQAAPRLAAMRTRIDRSYAEALAGKNGLPDAAHLHALLAARAGSGGEPASDRRAAAVLAQGYAALFDSTLGAMQREIDLFKEAMRAAAQRACAGQSRLLALDKLVDPVITREVRQAHRELAHAYERRCGTRIQAAIRELAPGCGVPAVEALLAPRGALGRLLHDARRLIHALLDLEWSMVHGLLGALCLEQDAAARR